MSNLLVDNYMNSFDVDLELEGEVVRNLQGKGWRKNNLQRRAETAAKNPAKRRTIGLEK